MSKGKNTKLTKEDGGEYKVPEKVINANWRDDVPEEKEAEDAQIEFEYYGDEEKYKFTGELTERAKELLAIRSLRNRLKTNLSEA